MDAKHLRLIKQSETDEKAEPTPVPKPIFKSRFARAMQDFADQLDQDIEAIKNF